jgi:transposase, IS30 family
MSYHHLSDEERHTLSILREQGASQGSMGRALGRNPSTISRELKRNRSTHDGCYRYSAAGELYRGRLRRSRRNQHYSQEDFAPVERLIREKLSPAQIVGRANVEGAKIMCHQTIYLWIWADQRGGGTLWRNLRGSRKTKRKRYGQPDSRGRLAGKKLISERPAIVEQRSRLGDLEIDTMHGSDKACILTIVDRKSGLVRIGPLPQATALHTQARAVELLGPLRPHVHTLTSDNGTEFHGYKYIEQKLGAHFYFANPHHAWERGSNENTNGLIRQYLPKRTSLRNLTQRQCDIIAEKLNNRPRLRLGFKTPNEVYHLSSQIASCGKLFSSCPRKRSIPHP